MKEVILMIRKRGRPKNDERSIIKKEDKKIHATIVQLNKVFGEVEEVEKVRETLDKRLSIKEKKILENERGIKFRTKYSPIYCNLVRELMRVGKTKIEVARDLDIGYTTFVKWERDIPEFRIALIDGHFLCMAWWLKTARQCLKQRATDAKINTTLYTFMMKNLFNFVDSQTKVMNQDLLEIDTNEERKTSQREKVANGGGGNSFKENAEVLDILRAVAVKPPSNEAIGTENK